MEWHLLFFFKFWEKWGIDPNPEPKSQTKMREKMHTQTQKQQKQMKTHRVMIMFYDILFCNYLYFVICNIG